MIQRCAPVLALALALAVPATAQPASTPCPCSASSLCATVTLVALVDQVDTLGLTGAQLDDLQPLRDRHLHDVHDVIGDIQSLQETLHGLDRPYDVGETFALLYELERHEVELAESLREAEGALLGHLTDAQRVRWAALVADAATLQGSDLTCDASP